MHSESEGESRVRWGKRGFIASFFAVEETGAQGAAMEADKNGSVFNRAFS